MLVVTTPATDTSLLTIAEMRAAVGLTDSSRDADLNILGPQLFEAIARECNVRSAGATTPTLRLETLTETFRGRADVMILSRRPVVSITSVTEDGVLLSATDYEVELGAGLLYRLYSDTRSRWTAAKTVVVYTAGWATVPPLLKRAATQILQAWWNDTGRDPLVQHEKVEGIGETWFAPGSLAAIPEDAASLLDPFREPAI